MTNWAFLSLTQESYQSLCANKTNSCENGYLETKQLKECTENPQYATLNHIHIFIKQFSITGNYFNHLNQCQMFF